MEDLSLVSRRMLGIQPFSALVGTMLASFSRGEAVLEIFAGGSVLGQPF